MTFRGKTIYGSATHRVVIDFHDRPSPKVSGQVRFYDRETLEEEKQFPNFKKLSDIVKRYWEAKTRTEVFDRRLASWFADYFHEMGLRGIDSYEVLEWLKGGTSELTAETIDRDEKQRIKADEAERQKQIEFREQIRKAEGEKTKIEKEASKEEHKEELEENVVKKIEKPAIPKEALPTLPNKKEESIMTADDMVKAVLERVEPKDSKKKATQQRRRQHKPKKRAPRKK